LSRKKTFALGRLALNSLEFGSAPTEPRHIHVESDDNHAKFWLEPIDLAKSVGYKERELSENGREISLPLGWFPRLKEASPKQRKNWRLIGKGIGIHRPDLDEDISVSALLK